MAAGLPVVGVQAPGMTDLVQSGSSGYLTQFPDGGLAAGMVALGGDREKCRQFSHNAQQASLVYDIRHTVAKTLTLYHHLLAVHPKPSKEERTYFSLSNSVTEQVEQLGHLLRNGWRGERS